MRLLTWEVHQRSRTKALTLHSLPPLCKPLTVPNNVVSSGEFHAFSLSFPQYPRAYMKGARQVDFECVLWRLHINRRWGFNSLFKRQSVCQSPDFFFLVLAEGLPLTEWLLGLFVRYYRTTDPLSSWASTVSASHTESSSEVFDWRNGRFVVMGVPAH